MSRIHRERATVREMIALYCRGNHGGSETSLCPVCSDLASYADGRLSDCPFGESKGACRSCPIHCYDDGRRILIGDVMRYSGPRMLLRRPLDAIVHLVRPGGSA